MKLMEVFGRPNYGRSSWDSNMPSRQQREQDNWNASDRDFKRREMEAELGHEDKWPSSRQRQQRPVTQQFNITINGKVWQKEGAPVVFFNAQRAEGAAEKIRARMTERGQQGEVMIVPTQR